MTCNESFSLVMLSFRRVSGPDADVSCSILVKLKKGGGHSCSGHSFPFTFTKRPFVNVFKDIRDVLLCPLDSFWQHNIVSSLTMSIKDCSLFHSANMRVWNINNWIITPTVGSMPLKDKLKVYVMICR